MLSRPLDRDIILQRVRAGETQSAIASDFGVNQTTISKIVVAARAQGLLPERRATGEYTEAQRAAALRMRALGSSRQKIMDALGLRQEQLSAIFFAADVQVAPAPKKVAASTKGLCTVCRAKKAMELHADCRQRCEDCWALAASRWSWQGDTPSTRRTAARGELPNPQTVERYMPS